MWSGGRSQHFSSRAGIRIRWSLKQIEKNVHVCGANGNWECAGFVEEEPLLQFILSGSLSLSILVSVMAGSLCFGVCVCSLIDADQHT